MGKGPNNSEFSTRKLTQLTYQFFDIVKTERQFLILISGLFLICGLAYPYTQIAMWLGFAIAAYSAIGNDSIQTIGTFIASNKHKKWYYLWLFIGLIFVATVTHSWIQYGGDVTHQRLATKGFSEAPETFGFFQLAAPIILLILTRMSMPVSTTFLLLNIFATDAGAMYSVLSKSIQGYFVAFGVAIIVWFLIGKLIKKYAKGTPHPAWRVIQWITSGSLWSFWIMHDAANIAVFLPRSLSLIQFIGFTGFIFVGLGLLFYKKGDRIQEIVNKKTIITDVRAATIVDFIYAIILFVFKIKSQIPMSTTWVFIGLLGGRELAINLTRSLQARRKNKLVKKAWKMIAWDLFRALIGLVISVILALIINEKIRSEICQYFF